MRWRAHAAQARNVSRQWTWKPATAVYSRNVSADELSRARGRLQEVLLGAGREGGRPCHCAGMVRAPETVEVANFLIDRMGRGALTAELLQPDELVAGIIAQVEPSGCRF